MNSKIKWLIFLSVAVVTTLATPFFIPYLSNDSNHFFRSTIGGLIFGFWVIFILPSFFLNLFVSYYLEIPEELSSTLITVFVGLQFLVLAGVKILVDKIHGTKKFLVILILGLLALLILLGLLAEYSIGRSLQKQFNTTGNKNSATTSATRAELKPVKQQIPGWLIYQSEYLSFEYPSRLRKCCGIQTNPGNTLGMDSRNLITLGDVPANELGSDRPFDGLKMVVDSNTKKVSFSDYVETQKNGWKQNFLDFTQNNPVKLSENELIVGRQKGVILKGYTWFGADMIYVPFPEGQKILIIAKTEKTAGSFVEFEQILKTLSFVFY